MSLIETDDHDLGLQHDLEKIAQFQQRRRMLGMLFSGSAALLAGCGVSHFSDSSSGSNSNADSSNSSGSNSAGSSASACMADPSETQGPYPADGSNSSNGVVSNVLNQSGVVRSDIRGSFGGATGSAAGVLLTLTLNLVSSNNSCSPLAGYVVYLWHCDRTGNYSLYSSSVINENYLRGVQASDSTGAITFVTIFPGCYSGRWPHIHFEVYPSLAAATGYTNKILTSQMALPETTCVDVYTPSSIGYTNSLNNLGNVSLASDGIFGDNTAAEIAWQTPTLTGNVTDGYTGTINIGIPL